MGYDQAGRQTLLFGGQGPGGSIAGDTWEWNGSGWTSLAPASAPAPRYKAAMAGDTDRNRVVMFGGQSPNGELQDTWEWDGSNWKQMFPVHVPRMRHHHAMAYDAGRQVIVMYGGFTANTDSQKGEPPQMDLSDTWEWNGMDWTQRPTQHNPGAAKGWDGHGMAYDQWRQVTVLYGGGQDTGGQLVLPNETWTYDGQDWKNVTPQNPSDSPPARSNPGLAYNEASTEVMIFGGSDGSKTYFDDTWSWNGTKWIQFTSSTHPGKRTQHAMTYDRLRDRMVMFGGIFWDGTPGHAATEFGDTWELKVSKPRPPRPLP
jgi:hypothetical protein